MAYKVTLIHGDGTGPEVVEATRRVLEATGVKFEWEVREAGLPALEKLGTILPEETLSSIRRNRLALKGPITTPRGTGFRSVNVALRKILDLYACLRPCKWYPGVRSRYEDIDLVIVRENHEDLYAGIEFERGDPNLTRIAKVVHESELGRVPDDAGLSLKIISESRSRRIARFAFEYARRHGRRKVTAIAKENIMKFTDGLFIATARKVAQGYPDIEFEEMLVDNMCMQLVQKPEIYDVLLLANLYGDIVSDLCAGLVGGLGVAPGANMDDGIALFEPVHGSAPKYAGLNKVNPMATMFSGLMMLRYLEEEEAAERLERALAEVIAEGKSVTYDMKPHRDDPTAVGTSQVADAVIAKLEEMKVAAQSPLQDLLFWRPERREGPLATRLFAAPRPAKLGNKAHSEELEEVFKVVFFNGQGERVAEIFQGTGPAGFEVAWRPHRISDEEKLPMVQEADFLVLHPAELSGGLLREAKRLRLLQLLSAGYDRIDLGLAGQLGVPVATNGGANAWAVAEHAIALLMALYKRLIPGDRAVREGRWRQGVTGYNIFEVAEKTVGIIGAGNIGRKVARRLAPFETRILYYDVIPAPEIEKDLGARRVSLEELLREADIVTLHLPLMRETRGLIGQRELAMMKTSAVLLNTSRGPVLDEEALSEALREGKIAGAGLDVFHQEPLSPDHPLLQLENVILSPHIGGHSYEGWFRRSRFAWENIQRVTAGQPPLSLAVPED